MKNAKATGVKEDWNLANTAATTALTNVKVLSMKQEGERKAWGLDKGEEDKTIEIKNSRSMISDQVEVEGRGNAKDYFAEV
jgi:hypothetical protein